MKSISGRPALALLWLLFGSSIPSITSAQSAVELLALASRGEGSVTITKTKTSVTPPVDLSLVSYKTGTDADDETADADGNNTADPSYNTTAATPSQGEISQVPADMGNGPSHNATNNMPDLPSVSISQVPGETESSSNATVVTTVEQINGDAESAHVVSPDSYRTSGSISYLLRGRRRRLAKRRG